jgi:hypothetical protein
MKSFKQFFSENIGGIFKDASEWEKSAKARGLVVKPATHPSGEMIKYQIAKDKNGNNRGHFDHGTKSGHLKEEVVPVNEEVELDETPNSNWADSAISHSKNQERVAKQQIKTMKAKNSAAKEFQKSSEIHAKTAKADHDTIRARTGQMEEVELDEVSSSTLRSYIDKSRADKSAAMKDRTAAEKNVKQYGMASDKKERDDAARRVVNRNTGVSIANKKLGTYPTDKAKAKVMAREEVELGEETMPGNVALRLVDRHHTAAFHHKKNGNMKGYAAHFKVANAIEDSVIRAGRDMPIRSKRLEAASDKVFKEHPHSLVKNNS